MGSRSDWAVVEHAATTLDELDVPYDVRIVSAGRPELRARLRAWRAAQTEQVLSAPDPRQP